MRRGGLLVALAAVLTVRPPDRLIAQADSLQAVRQRFWVRPVASLLLPGSGQVLSHQSRAAAYLAAELYTLVRYLQLTRSGRSSASAFRDIAFDVARHAFSPSPAQRDTAWEYFETMERYGSSGQFNLSGGPGLVPEADTTTYNGSVWLLARRTYWRDPATPPDPTSPEYANALQFYLAHAVGPAYLWSWQGADSALGVYRATIMKSDNAFRHAQNYLGLLLADHLASAVDALISTRLASVVRRPVTLNTTVAPGRFMVNVSLSF